MTAPTGKGRPTPKRSEAQRQRSGHVAPPPQTRKEAAKRQKEEAAASRARTREGAARGDDRYLPKRDAGPVRALVRDVIDSRRNVGVILLPLALALIVVNLSRVTVLQTVGLLLWLVALLLTFVDVVATTLVLRRRLREQFPEQGRLVGHVAYGLLRSTVLRRFRMPPPRVSPGKD